MTTQQQLSRLRARQLSEAAGALAGFRMTRPTFGSAANVSGIRTKTLTYSERHDSRTVFATDVRYGPSRRAGAWTGDDRIAIAALRRALKGARIPAKEIASVDVVSDMGAVGERVGDGEFRIGEPALLRKLARATRAVEGVPVWSSYALCGLTAEGEMGRLEVHWPEVPSAEVKEAMLLQELARRFKSPELAGASVEAVEAGIIHSPAVGFYLDVTAAIRVIYAVDELGIGRKPVLYLDRHGEPVAMPRDIEPAKPDGVERSKPR